MSVLKCWEFNRCPEQTRLNCTVYPDYGTLCYALAGTFCVGSVQGTYAGKNRNCRRCDYLVYLKNNGLYIFNPNAGQLNGPVEAVSMGQNAFPSCPDMVDCEFATGPGCTEGERRFSVECFCRFNFGSLCARKEFVRRGLTPPYNLSPSGVFL